MSEKEANRPLRVASRPVTTSSHLNTGLNKRQEKTFSVLHEKIQQQRPIEGRDPHIQTACSWSDRESDREDRGT